MSDTWTTKTSAPVSRDWLPVQAAAVNGIFYIVGGYNSGHKSEVYAYDVAADSWSQKASSPVTPSYGVQAGCAGKVISIAASGTIYEYDPSADSWEAKATSLPGPSRWFCSAVAVDDWMYVLGGYDNSTAYDLLYRYDPVADVWESLAAMPLGLRRPSVAEIFDVIYVTGGTIDAQTPNHRTFAYSLATNTWSEVATAPAGVNKSGATNASGALNGKFIVHGDSGFVNAETHVYDPSTDTWTEKTAAPARRDSAAGAVHNNLFYVLLGSTGADPRADVYAYEPDWEAPPGGGLGFTGAVTEDVEIEIELPEFSPPPLHHPRRGDFEKDAEAGHRSNQRALEQWANNLNDDNAYIWPPGWE